MEKVMQGDNSRSVDRISQLPDDIIIKVLSRLSMEEAARTSVLSRTWVQLWRHITVLDFDGSKIIGPYRMRPEPYKPRYIEWVNQVLRSHQGGTVDEFVVFCPLDQNSKCAIDEWLKFALGKGVQTLKMDLLSYSGRNLYTFSDDCLPAAGQSLSSTTGCLGGSNRGFSRLTSLSLKDVNVNDQSLEYLLSNCPLEHLLVNGSKHLLNLKIAGPSLKLKHLVILTCFELVTLEISAPNLLSFTFFGKQTLITMKNAPLLREANFSGWFRGFADYACRQLLSCLSQLVTLKLNIWLHFQEPLFFPVLPEFTKLKRLELEVTPHGQASLLGLSSLMEASPFLEEILLELIWPWYPSKTILRKGPKTPHKHLKIVEITGFVGRQMDVEFIKYVLENAVALEKIIIDPKNQYKTKDKEKRENAARYWPAMLQREFGPGPEFVVRL